MDRADLVYKLVEELESVLESYVSSGIEVAVLISKVNDNVVGYQGTKLGKDFLEKNTHFTEEFRKFCKDYWYNEEILVYNPSPKQVQIGPSNDEDVSFLSSSETGAVLNGIETFTILDGSRLPPVTNEVRLNDDGTPRIVFQTSKVVPVQFQNRKILSDKVIRRKAKYSCPICSETYFRRTHRLNIHMHEFHKSELTATELDAYPLPEGYVPKSAEQKEEDFKKTDNNAEKRKLLYRYRCEECNINFKRLERFNEHRDKRHKLQEVDEDYGLPKDGYQCEYCPKIFASRWNLQRHIDIHLGKKRFRCDICNQSFFRNDELKKHLLIHNNDSQPKKVGRCGRIQCLSCGNPMRHAAGKGCEMPSAHNEKSEVIEPVFKCKTCKKIFDNEDGYNNHMSEHECRGKEVMSEHDYINIQSNVDNSSQSNGNNASQSNGSNASQSDEDGISGDIQLDLVIKAIESQDHSYGVSDDNAQIDKCLDGKKLNSSGNTDKVKLDDGKTGKQVIVITKKQKKGSSKTEILPENQNEVMSENQTEDVIMYQDTEQMNESINEENEDVEIQNKSLNQDENTPKIIKLKEEDLEATKGRYHKIDYEGAFTCKICSKSFVTGFTLKRHVLTHTNLEKIRCDLCGQGFSRKDLMQRHIQRVHASGKRFQCNLCPITCKDAIGLTYHKFQKHKSSIKKGDEITCKVCSATFNYPSSLRKHMKSVHSDKNITPIHLDDNATPVNSDDNVTPVHSDNTVTPVIKKEPRHSEEDFGGRKRKAPPCFGCDEDCGSHMTSKAKVAKKSDTTPSEKFETSKESQKQKEPSTPKPVVKKEGFEFSISDKSHENYTCNICMKSFRYQSEFTSHQLIHSNKKVYPCAMCSLVYLTPMNFKQHLEKHDYSGHFSCDQCKYATDSLEHLNRHKSSHKQDKEKKLKNDISGSKEKTASKNDSSSDKEKTPSKKDNVESKLKPKCDTCGKVCSTMYNLKLHMKKHEKSFKCSTCAKTFQSKDNLKSHEKIHEETKSYECEECGASFKQQPTLIRHRQTHKSPDIECKMCNRKFKVPSALRNHMIAKHPDTTEVPDDLKCRICNKAFPTVKEIDRHYRTHTGEKPFACRMCDKKFSDRSNWKAHENIHAGAQHMNRCGECLKEFMRPSDLKKHVERVHSTIKRPKKFKCNHCDKTYNYRRNLAQHVKDDHQISNDSEEDVADMETSTGILIHHQGQADTQSKENKSAESDQESEKDSEVECSQDKDGLGEGNENASLTEDVDSASCSEQSESTNKQTTASSPVTNRSNDNIFTVMSAVSLAPRKPDSQNETVSSTALKSLLPTTKSSETATNVEITNTPSTNPLVMVERLPLDVQNVLLQSSDGETGSSTIYVVQSDTGGTEESQVIYWVTEDQT